MSMYTENFERAVQEAEETLATIIGLGRLPEGLDNCTTEELYKMSADFHAVGAQLEAYIMNRTSNMDTA